MCSWGKVGFAWSSNSPVFSVSFSGFRLACFLFIADAHLLTSCMALQIVRSVTIAVCKGQLAWAVWQCRLFAVYTGQLTCRRCSLSILKKWNLTNPSSLISHCLYGSPPYLSTLCSWGKVEFAWSSNSLVFSVSFSGFRVVCFLFIGDAHLLTSCMALETVRSVTIAVCKGQLAWTVWRCRPFAVCMGQLACRRCSPSILKKWNLTNSSS
jgi:hypothetical protein